MLKKYNLHHMKLLPGFLLLIIFSVILNACSFTSQSRSKSPYFNGILKFNDIAIKNAKIMLSTEPGDKQCIKAKTFTDTDNQGKFNLAALTEEYTYTPFVNYEFDEWTVCARYNEQIYTLYSNNRYSSGNVVGSVYLQCDLAQRPVTQPCTISQ